MLVRPQLLRLGMKKAENKLAQFCSTSRCTVEKFRSGKKYRRMILLNTFLGTFMFFIEKNIFEVPFSLKFTT